jgi:YD repeat-containing protein
MKVTLLLVILIFSVFDVHTQTLDQSSFSHALLSAEHAKIKEVVIEYSDNSQQKEAFKYDDEGKIIEIETYDYIKGDWVLNKITINAYNTTGNLYIQERKELVDKKWVKTTRDILRHDKNSNLIEKRIEKFENDTWFVNSINYYKYDGSNNLIQESMKRYSYGNWFYKYKYTYTYNSISNLISMTEWKHTGTTWVICNRVLYWYNIKAVIAIENRLWINNGWIRVSKSDIIYNKLGQENNRENSIFENDEWKLHSKSESEYDDDGMKVRETTQILDSQNSSNWINYSDETIRYNYFNHVVEWSEEISENESWNTTFNKPFTFEDDYGNIFNFDDLMIYDVNTKVKKVNVTWIIPELEIVLLSSPTNLSEDLEIEEALSWTETSYTDFYHVQLSESKDFEILLLDKSDTKERTIPIKNLKYNTTYYWRVRAINSIGSGNWSEIWSFRTIEVFPPQDPVVLQYPNDNAKEVKMKNLELEWLPTENTDSYLIQVSLGPSFEDKQLVYNIKNIQSNIVNLAPLGSETLYYWRVRAVNKYGNGPWAETWVFTTEKLVSVEDLSNKYNVLVFPNPTYKNATISYSLPQASSVEISLFDQSGNIVISSGKQDQTAGPNQFKFATNKLSSGTYYYTIHFLSQIQSGKLAIVK